MTRASQSQHKDTKHTGRGPVQPKLTFGYYLHILTLCPFNSVEKFFKISALMDKLIYIYIYIYIYILLLLILLASEVLYYNILFLKY